jgi:hypothetical protein
MRVDVIKMHRAVQCRSASSCPHTQAPRSRNQNAMRAEMRRRRGRTQAVACVRTCLVALALAWAALSLRFLATQPRAAAVRTEPRSSRVAALAAAEAAHQRRMRELEAASREADAVLAAPLVRAGAAGAQRVFRRAHARLDADRRVRAEQERWKAKVRTAR